jgi:hypothetical protein
MSQILFKDYLYEKFLEWEKNQSKRRSSFSAYARWLSDNSLNIEVKQQNVDTWMNGKIPKDYKFVVVLAEKIGDEIYDILDKPRPNPHLQKVNRAWEFIPEDVQIKLSAEAEKYEAQNISDRIQKTSKPRKIIKSK